MYALTVANGKPKMTKADDSERAGCRNDPNAPRPFTNLSLMVAIHRFMIDINWWPLHGDFPQWLHR